MAAEIQGQHTAPDHGDQEPGQVEKVLIAPEVEEAVAKAQTEQYAGPGVQHRQIRQVHRSPGLPPVVEETQSLLGAMKQPPQVGSPLRPEQDRHHRAEPFTKGSIGLPSHDSQERRSEKRGGHEEGHPPTPNRVGQGGNLSYGPILP